MVGISREDQRPLVDRRREQAALRDLASQSDRRLGILYGRRQVGKTFLLAHAWPDRRVFYFVAADTTVELNKRDLIREAAGWSGRALDAADYPTWRTVFRLLLDLADDGPLVVVLDEFQYLLRAEEDLPSQLVAVWDREAPGRPLTLVLSGSEVSTMERLLGGSQPLYGRVDWSDRLYPFDYFDAAAMLGDRPARDAARFYGVLGGTPRYLAAIRPTDQLADTVVREILAPSGSVHLQQAVLVEQEKGIRAPEAYRAVLTAVAAGRTLLNEIVQDAGLVGDEDTVRRALRILEDLEVVGRWRNYQAGEKAPYRYRLVDNAVAFWHRFVVPNRSRLATADPADVWTGLVEPGLDTYIGPVFERMVAQAYRRFHVRLGLPAAREWSSWQGQDRNRRPIEIDLVAELDDGRLLTGEVKWSSQPRGFELHNDLRRDLEDLAASGRGWAREALDGEHLYVSAAGFDERFAEWADAQPNVHLWTLADLYPPAS